MKLSEQLESDHSSGDFGKALEGYSARAKKLEDAVYWALLDEAVRGGANPDKAVEFAAKRLKEI